MIKRIVLIFILFIWFFNVVSANIKYNYVCDNIDCHNTRTDFISNNYYLYPINIFSVNNLSVFIKKKLDEYIAYYWNTTLRIDGYCVWTCDIIENKEMTLSWLLSIKTSFSIWKEAFFWFSKNTILETYDSWKDYLFSNFYNIITSMHSGFPIWDLKPNLSDILQNILSYDNLSNKFNIKNICTNSGCTESLKKDIILNDTNSYTFLSWIVKQSSFFKNDTFNVSNDYNISKLVIQAWESVNFNFWFEDYLDQFSDKTEYEYKIYYNYDWEWLPDESKPYLTEKIIVDWNTFKIISSNVNAWDLYDINVLDVDNKKVRVWIKEWIKLTKTWKINFYLAVKNLTSWDKFDLKLVNSLPLLVLPNDDIKSWKSIITSAFTPELNSEPNWFNEDYPFDVELSLFDAYLNNHFDEIIWYDILLSNWTSSYVQLAVWNGAFSDKITWLKTTNNTVKFKFRVTKAWYHDFNWFDITVKTKSDLNNYVIPYSYHTIKNVIPSNLYDGDQKMKIYIKAPIYSTLPVSCWQVVTINFKCTSDNFSWCKISGNTNKTYSSQLDNWTKWSLSIIDRAYNKRIYEYTMNHVDTTAPTIKLSKWLNQLNWSNYTYIANSDSLNINFYEWTTSSCQAEVNYIVKLNWVLIKNWLLNWESTNFFINNIFEKSWTKNLYIKATDKYWNFSEKNIVFIINPDKVDESKSTIVLKNWLRNTKYANNYDKYEYELKLTDKYSNAIYNKEILSLNTDCSVYSWCNNLKTLLETSGNDALMENYDNITDINWLINLTLKSLAPWNFKEIFKIKMHEWDINYNNISNTRFYNIWNFSSNNSFLKPVIWNLSITEWWKFPEMWKSQKYKVWLEEKSGNLTFNNWLLDVSKDTIINKTTWHFWNTFSLINKDFSNKINTFIWFSWSIDANNNILSWVNLSSKDLIISYILWWVPVKYILDDFWLNWCNVNTLWLKIIWNIQWNWKSGITWQKANFSDISKLDLRTKIRNNWFKLIKSMKNWQILNRVKYVKWDVNISWNVSWYETLIVYNWNVIIDGDLNINWNKLWIIVLKDNYLVSSDYHKSWNIYVNKAVEKINAIIYADWWFFSSRSDWTRYQDIELNKLLTLNWTLFTRNTVGWAVKANSKYLLPWWEETSNFNLAHIYDLNYIRKVDNQCLWDNYSFLIKYDSKVQLNPPIGFEN